MHSDGTLTIFVCSDIAFQEMKPLTQGNKVAVKHTLRKYAYPPDKQKLATETGLYQAKMIAEELVG